MKRAVFVLACALLSACASVPGLYAELGAGYQLKAKAVAQPECIEAVTNLSPNPRSCGGSNPSAHITLGYEFEHGSSCELWHYSHYFSGWPLNEDPELYIYDLQCSKRWGGRNAHR